MEQAHLAILEPNSIGHNVPPDALSERLLDAYGSLVARFLELEIGCGRVPDPIANAEEAGLVTDFIAQCQAQLRVAEATHKEEKASYLSGGRIVDAFFKRRCERLSAALVPVLARLKNYRDRLVASEAARYAAALEVANTELRRAREEEARHRNAAERVAQNGQDADARAQAAQHLRLAEAAAERVWEATQRAAREPEPIRIEGDYGAVAYATRSWSYEVVDLDAVPRNYLTLDNERVRAAVAKEHVREIPGLRIFECEELRVRGVL